MLRVFKTTGARHDLTDIWVFIAEDSIDAADAWVAQLDAAIQRLAEFPGIGRPRDDIAAGLRVLPIGDYLIFYRFSNVAVEILRVFHGMRDVERIMRGD